VRPQLRYVYRMCATEHCAVVLMRDRPWPPIDFTAVAEGAPTVTLPEGGATPFNPLWEPSTPLTARAN